MNRHHRRAERAACRQGTARVPRRVVERKATKQEVDDVAVVFKLMLDLVRDNKEALKAVPPAATASVLLDAACMFLAGAHIAGEELDWDGIRSGMNKSFVDHLNKLREKK